MTSKDFGYVIESEEELNRKTLEGMSFRAAPVKLAIGVYRHSYGTSSLT